MSNLTFNGLPLIFDERAPEGEALLIPQPMLGETLRQYEKRCLAAGVKLIGVGKPDAPPA